MSLCVLAPIWNFARLFAEGRQDLVLSIFDTAPEAPREQNAEIVRPGLQDMAQPSAA